MFLIKNAYLSAILGSMVTTTQIRRYAWVVELLLRRKRLTLQQINQEWQRSVLSDFTNEKHDRKTWYKCFDDLGMIYGILIELTPKSEGSKYYILNPEALKGRDVQQWMLGCVAHRNLLEECLGMYNRTDIEGFPSENGMLLPIVQAMRENRKMEVIYRRYGSGNPKKHVVEPYFIKTYNHRFYVLCKYDTGQFFTLSFDRMLEARLLKEHFNFPNDLFAQDFFEDSFGVMVPSDDVKTVDVIVRAKGDARYYLQDVPLHKSQNLVKEESEYSDFTYHVKPTNDFIGAILQQGDRLRVIAPEEVKCMVRDRHRDAYMQYLES